MAISQSDFVLSEIPDPIKVVLGMDGIFRLMFKNTSATERGYNLTVEMTLPDGVSYVDSSIIPTSVEENPDGTVKVSWINIKDLAPNEIDYSIEVKVKSDDTFRSTGLPVPFDVPLVSVDITATVDTLPRGDEDIGNVKITKTDSANFIPLRYNLLKTAPSKMPKGAGLISPDLSPLWPYQYKLTVMNNIREPSTVTLIDNLPNGVRYLGGLTVSGPDSIELSSPNIIVPTPGPDCQDYVTLDWQTVTLSEGSVNIITFDVAIWDNYTEGCEENSGERIPHSTPLQNVAILEGISGPVQAVATTRAMDATIDKTVDKKITDVGEINTYTLTYKINQYDDIDSFTITDIIEDGQEYNVGSASLAPDSVTVNPDGTTELVWNLGYLSKGTTGTITFTTTVKSNYSSGEPVSSDDVLSDNVNIDGINQTTLTNTPDTSSASSIIRKPNIKKEILNYYYKDGTLKPMNVAAPGDEVEFRITYSSVGITASQKNIEIDEYAPLNMGPLTAGMPITYGGTLPGPFTPVTVSPNGLRWSAGTVPGNTIWTATFKVPVQNIDFVGARNNLAKLAGENTKGFAYSERDQVEVVFGEPNIQFQKTVTGPNINAIKAGETYTYSITISNMQNAEGTVVDAFEMDLTDVIPDGLTYAGTYTVTGTGEYDDPVFSGQNVSMTIKKLAPDESLTLSFDVTVDSTIVSGQVFTNNAVLQRPYSQPDRSYQYPGEPFTAQTTLKAESIELFKLVKPLFAKIGDIVTYIIQVTIPEGTNAYNVQVIDTFPDTTQTYIAGSATKDGVPITPTVSGGTVIFPVIPYIDATASSVDIIYAFDVRVIGGTHEYPYIEKQINKAEVKWDMDISGPPAVPVSTSATLEVRTPHLRGLKEQRNVTKGGRFTKRGINYEVGDVIEYRISITNDGAETAFNTIVTDELNSLLSFNSGSIITTHGTAIESGGTITWNIPILNVGETATLMFSVTTLPGVAAGGRIPDKASFVYSTNNNGFEVTYGPDKTNTVRLRAPKVGIEKSASITEGEIGDDITYTITITVPNGTIAYTPLIEDILPVGQTYIGPATRQELPNPPTTVVPTISGQTVTFPINSDIDATSGQRTIIYTFLARITSATHNPPFYEIQTDTAKVKWAITSGGSFKREEEDEINITARTPNIAILKEQTNFTNGGSYTTENISGLPEDLIYYRLTVTSNGASPAYNVNIQDVLNSNVTFVGIISGPTEGSVVLSGNILTWNIPQLDTGNSATLEFAVSINSGIGAGAEITDNVTSTYDSNDVNPITYTEDSNSVLLNIPLLEIEKTASTNVAAIGDTITYTLKVTIPYKVNAYNLVIKDVIPARQQYVPGSWSPGTPTISGNEITFNEPTTPQTGPQTLIYTFQTTVISGTTTYPYTEIQRNLTEVIWDITPTGPEAPPVSDYVDVEIRSPHIIVLKEQRNVTQGGSFTTGTLLGVATGDIVEYRITLTNDGANTAYNVITTDNLDPSLTFTGVVISPPGTVTSSVPLGSPDGTITWTETSIAAGESRVLVFSVQVNSGPPPGTSILNQTSTVYDTSPTNPTTLGPELSNIVGFNYTLPKITKNVDKSSVFVGDTVTYTIEITIPNGNIAYDVQVVDNLPPNQSYVPDSLTRNGVPIIPSPTLTFPQEGTIDATAGAVTIVYTFKAVIDSVSTSPQDIQINTATINWNTAPGGPAGTPQTDTVEVYVTDLNIELLKEQKNFTTGGSFTTDLIQVSVGDIIHYQLTVTNPSPTYTLYNVTVEDNLDNLLKFISEVILPPAGVIVHTGESSNGKIIWSIPSIPPLTSYSAVVAVKVLPGGVAQSSISDNISATFSVVSGPSPTYGPILSNSVEAKLPSLQIDKSVSKDDVEIGEIIEYTLSVTVPEGTIAYNVVLTDILPNGQVYVGEATKDGVLVFPSISGQLVTFDTEDLINATTSSVTIVYTFKARIVMGAASDPYIETQINNAEVNWNIDASGTPAVPSKTSKDVIVRSPFFLITKEQSNVTKFTGYEINPIFVETGDIVEFRLSVENLGKAPAYNVVITDVLDQFEDYKGVVDISAGTIAFDALNKKLTWIIDVLDVDTVEVLSFRVEILGGISAGGEDSNIATAYYDTNQITPITYGPFNSNEVVQIYPNVRIAKTSNIDNAAVGDIITYTVEFILPKGTVAYNGQFTDILPIGQIYNGNATLNGVPITPEEVVGQFIAFPKVPYAEAVGADAVFKYKFEAKVVSAIVDPVSLVETQTNEGYGNWDLEPGIPANPVNDVKEIKVTDSTVDIYKFQRNASKEENFTDNPIYAYPNETIEFKIQIVNTGPRTVYDIEVADILSDKLKFIESIYVPAGTILTHSGETQGGTVKWLISLLEPGDSLEVIFSVKLLDAVISPIFNKALASFRISETNPDRFGNLSSNTTQINIPLQSECIIAEKIYSQCLKKICLYDIELNIPQGYMIDSIKFNKGEIVPGSLKIIETAKQHFRRVTFLVTISYIIRLRNELNEYLELQCKLPDYEVNIVMFIPEHNDEQQFDILLDTYSNVLYIDEINKTFIVGIYNIVSAALKTQLLIPSFGYCQDILKYECEGMCEDFGDMNINSYEDFYPKQE
ncbi:DUF11 domain-containing protein [Caloranaerobacter ferrireducens]|uniref:DUF11 domain-containing protein n=1 Tax=Caloranaerobacter ferrireducens TaxID=1323370 RepID=UPI00084D4F4E|nr:DUF11 domain-containing protein [Caloranaerobacter ferrireducens]